MAKAYIFNEHLDGDDRTAIEAAIKNAGYEPVYVFPTDISVVDPECDIGVVGLPVAAEDEPVVNERSRAFGGAGIRVIGIWLRECEEGGSGLPEGLEKYGSTTVDIGSPNLPDTLKGESEVWEEAGGTPRPAPVTKRNKC